MVVCYGRRVFRRLLFPIVFLLWLPPWPQAIVSRVVSSLQQSSAWATYILLQLVGMPVAKNGVILSIPGFNLEIAQECSSIRSSMILIITSIVLVYLFLDSAWRRGLVLLAVFPLTFLKNALRIFALSVLAVYVDPEIFSGRFHKQGGAVFFWLLSGPCCC